MCLQWDLVLYEIILKYFHQEILLFLLVHLVYIFVAGLFLKPVLWASEFIKLLSSGVISLLIDLGASEDGSSLWSCLQLGWLQEVALCKFAGI